MLKLLAGQVATALQTQARDFELLLAFDPSQADEASTRGLLYPHWQRGQCGAQHRYLQAAGVGTHGASGARTVHPFPSALLGRSKTCPSPRRRWALGPQPSPCVAGLSSMRILMVTTKL